MMTLDDFVSKQSNKQGNTTVSESPLMANINLEETGLKPTKIDRKKFDIDLAYGHLHEDRIIDMLQNKKIEVKTERDMWSRTGNIAIEYQSYGKPSGVNATEADYWFHNLAIADDVYCTLVFSVDNLKKIVHGLDYHKSVSGGDNNASRMFLVNLSKLFSTDTLKLYKNLSTLV